MASKSQQPVHLVFKTHLDIGFTDYSHRVIDCYLNHFIPKAIALASSLEKREGDESFIWTTGSWVVDHALNQLKGEALKNFEEAILKGWLRWHGLPFTTHTELMDATLFRAGLGISKRLDRRFGLETKTAKMTDVPGHTIAIVPLMEEAGIEWMHLGINPASAVVEVPPIFRWQFDGAELMVAYQGKYGDDVITPSGERLHFALAGDNLGPPSEEEVLDLFSQTRTKFPGSKVRAGLMEDLLGPLKKEREELPVIYQEMGDTWIHGVGADPEKVARFRALSRLRSHHDGRYLEEEWRSVDAALLMIPEHTWGMDEKTHLRDYRHYTRADFEKALQFDLVDPSLNPPSCEAFGMFAQMGEAKEVLDNYDCRFSTFAKSWEEQRRYLEEAQDALPEALQKEAAKVCAKARNEDPFPEVFHIEMEETGVEIGDWTLILSPDGSLGLLAFEDQVLFKNKEGGLGKARYVLHDDLDIQHFHQTYNRNMERPEIRSWAEPDFGKPGLKEHGRPGGIWSPYLMSSRYVDGALEAILAFDPEPHQEGGAPERMRLMASLFKGDLLLDLSYWNKPANRMPEALWWDFPHQLKMAQWSMVKLGHEVDPLSVLMGGARHLHAVESIWAKGTQARWNWEMLDAPLIGWGEGKLLAFDREKPDMNKGFGVCLHNNVWGTNFPMWYQGNGRCRVRLSCEIVKNMITT